MVDALRFWRYYRYPSYQWAMAIRQVLSEFSLDTATLIDAPCGDGVISYWLMRHGLGRRYELYDLSARSVAICRRLPSSHAARNNQLTIQVKDIHDIPVEGAANDIWLLINSLYLLPDVDRLVAHMRPRVQTVIGVFPNTASANYRRYTARSPATNIHEMGREETVSFFARHGYQVGAQQDLCYVPLNLIESNQLRKAASVLVTPWADWFPKKEANYWMAVFSRT